MSNQKYKLRYLPMFQDDFDKIIMYIMGELRNPKAASDLIDAVEEAIIERLPMAESFEPYYSATDRQYPYYRIYVRNFVIYYVVIDDEKENKIMEVRRFLHNKQNRERLL